ncbi:MAG TPA: TIGR01777 family oxidoreductase [Thermoanaerobaculia bacterium]|nr:TIGR01777 family oxidoreductase [Thermoanaerobaculia bacterium]
MKIVVAGGTGFIGEPLVVELQRLGEVVVLSRNPSKVRRGRGVAWDGRSQGPWSEEVREADFVVNLAGDNIGKGRWTASKKRRLRESRIDATRALVGAMSAAPRSGRAFVSMSAIGFYGDRGDEILDESSPAGDDFLARLCRDWEMEAQKAEGARVVIPRCGVVLAKDGGALPPLAMPIRLFVGGRLGPGDQWMSWVHRDDVIRFIRWAIEGKAEGVFNVTAPNAVTNREMTREVAGMLGRPAFFPAPSFALRLIVGEMADALLLGSQRVIPRRASIEQFVFQHRELRSALRAIYG